MRKALHDIEEAERFLLRQMNAGEKKAFAVRLLTEPGLHEQVTMQEYSYRLIRYHARLQKKYQLEKIHTQLMQDPEFSSTLQQIFL